MIKAVIFDMDGVIVDSEPLWEKAAIKYFKSVGKSLPQDRVGKKFINNHLRGRKWQEVLRTYKTKFGIAETYRQITNKYLAILFKIFNEELETMPGAIQLIQRLRQYGVPMLLASSSPKKVINFVVNRYQLKKYFKKIYSGDNVKKGKPHPEIFLKAARALKKIPKEILIIEDSISGIKAAKRGKMKCIALKQPYTKYYQLKTADLIVASLREVTLDKIKKL